VDVGAIDRETEQVELLGETRRLASGIRSSTEPLAGQLDQVAASAEKIKSSASSIDGAVASIDGAVTDIDKATKSINSSAKGIGGKAASIDKSAAAIGKSVSSISASAGEINGSGKGILGSFSGVLSAAKSIDTRLVDSTAKVDAILALARSINADLTNVLAHVGLKHDGEGGLTIHGHANSIDCSANAVLAGASSYCGK
jgi:methyl-accepting chemotaxis protein